jgi:cobalt-zinc-cadmium efflux system protein
MSHQHRASTRHRGRLETVLWLTAAVLLVEAGGAFATNSLALLADAGHMLTDVAGILMALIAIRVADRPTTNGRTFGYLRLEVLAAGANATLLAAVSIFVLVEAFRRLTAAPDVASGPMLVIAVVALVANGGSFLLLRDAQLASLNARGAYLEVLGDLFGSAAVLLAAGVIALTGWMAADAVGSIVIGLLILPRTFALFRETAHVLLEATPKGVDLGTVREHILADPGVVGCHDLHAWTITSGVNVISAHVVLEEGADHTAALDALSRCLADDFDLEHSTLQLETVDRRGLGERSHA